VEVLQPLMVFYVPVGSIRSVYVQLNACLEDLYSLLPVEVVVGDEGGEAPFEIMKPVLVVTAVTTSLFV
jgi:hypothetical protein